MKRAVEEKHETLPSVVKVKWIDGLRFVASDDKGHSVVMDVAKEQVEKAQRLVPCNSCWLLLALAQD